MASGIRMLGMVEAGGRWGCVCLTANVIRQTSSVQNFNGDAPTNIRVPLICKADGSRNNFEYMLP